MRTIMSLPPEYDKCLHKHTQYLNKTMVPEGVYVYLTGAKILDDDDKRRFNAATDTYEKNHTLLTIVAKHGTKGFEAFLEALKTTGQDGLASTLEATLQDQYSNVGKSIKKIKNDSKRVNTMPQLSGPSTSYSSSAGPQYIVSPTPRPGVSHSPSVSRSRSLTRTPLTPPLTEDELVNHIQRLKALLGKIGTTHVDSYCRQEANELLGELDEAGESMLDRVQQLSAENAEKERELRNAKYMVRGLEAEIQDLKVRANHQHTPTDRRGRHGHADDKGQQRPKSKTCVVL